MSLPDTSEIVRGVRAIGVIIQESNQRKVYHKLSRGYVPGAFKEGEIWCLSVPKWRRAVHGEAA